MRLLAAGNDSFQGGTGQAAKPWGPLTYPSRGEKSQVALEYADYAYCPVDCRKIRSERVSELAATAGGQEKRRTLWQGRSPALLLIPNSVHGARPLAVGIRGSG